MHEANSSYLQHIHLSLILSSVWEKMLTSALRKTLDKSRSAFPPPPPPHPPHFFFRGGSPRPRGRLHYAGQEWAAGGAPIKKMCSAQYVACFA